MTKTKNRSSKEYIIWQIAWILLFFAGKFFFRARVTGKENIPSGGAMLVIGNHGHVLDAVFISLALKRRVFFLANERLFKKKVIGKLLPYLAAVSKKKLEPDHSALRKLIRHANEGKCIGIFPEGKRSWDGRLLPFIPGIGKLILHLDIPVLIVLNKTSYLQSPQWAEYARWISIRQEIGQPLHFSKEITASEVEAVIREKMSFEPETNQVRGFSFAYGSALGLDTYLWACPECFSFNSLKPVGLLKRVIICTSCGCRWKVRLNNWLTGLNDKSPALHICHAMDKITGHFSKKLRNAGLSGIFLQNTSKHISISPDTGMIEGKGTITLYSNRISVSNGSQENILDFEFEGLTRLFVQEEKLHLLYKQYKINFKLPGKELLKWQFFIEQLHKKAN
jgi:1-acyl-sn-glycerol-3-phosphate acyltransferase